MRYFYLLFLLFGLTACGGDGTDSEEQTSEPENNFHLEGKIEGASLQTIRIQAESPNGTIEVAQTTTDASGKYVLDGNIPGMGLYSMTVGEDPSNAIVLPLDINDRVKIDAPLNAFAVSPDISGTSWARPLSQYMVIFREFAQKQSEELPKIADSEAKIKRYMELRLPVEDFIKKQVEKDPGNTVNIIFLSILSPSPQLGLKNWNPEHLELLKKIEAAYLEKHRDSPITSTMSAQIAQIDAAYKQQSLMNSGTLAAPEIALKNPEGKELRLSSLKGKVVLIDFWASWCGPCRKENPNVVRMYNKFRNRGFEIFSVSLDQDPNAWKTAITRDGLIWPNHVSDLLGWQTPLTQTYGFNAIPFTVLLNRQGNIVATNLRGEELERKLEEELRKK